MTILICFFLIGINFSEAQNGLEANEKYRNLEELKSNYPIHISRVIESIDLSYVGLESVAVSLDNKDTLGAIEQLLDYYKDSESGKWFTEDNIPNEDNKEMFKIANWLLQDTVFVRNTLSVIPKKGSGGWNWKYTGPLEDDEFGYSLNTHSYLSNLVHAWRETKNDEYLECFDRIVSDWIIQNPLPDKQNRMYEVFTNPSLDWRDIGELVWRDLDTGRRLEGSWVLAFHTFKRSKKFSDVAKVLMISSLIEQANYLQEYHKKGHNWTTMEMNGLSIFALTFPELNKSKEWSKYAMSVMEKEINGQVYPDGVQTEISSLTQWVALKPFEKVADNFAKAGYPVNESYTERIIDMYNYLSYSMRPDGFQALNNDSDRDDLRPRVLIAAEKYNRPDWTYIATNGQKGTKPTGFPSRVFPWAGINIFRDAWEKEALWLFFDNGPFGTGHQHADMLHISLSAFGKDLLVDGGRFTHKDYFSFDPKTWRGYFRSSYSHNTILIDEAGQKAGPLRSLSPLKEGSDFIHTSEYDFARGTFKNGYTDISGENTHSRSVLHLKNKVIVVMDQVITNPNRKQQSLWHFSPEASVEIDKNGGILAKVDEVYLEVKPLGLINENHELIKGKEEQGQAIQGWYSETYDEKTPNFTAVYTHKSPVSIWVMVPSKAIQRKLNAHILDVDENYTSIQISLGNDEPIIIKMSLDKDLPIVKGFK